MPGDYYGKGLPAAEKLNNKATVPRSPRKKAPVLAPLNGNIEAVNPQVQQRPALAHDDPYCEGWLFVVTSTNLKPDLEKMLFGQCNVAWVGSESHRRLGLLGVV